MENVIQVDVELVTNLKDVTLFNNNDTENYDFSEIDYKNFQSYTANTFFNTGYMVDYDKSDYNSINGYILGHGAYCPEIECKLQFNVTSRYDPDAYEARKSSSGFYRSWYPDIIRVNESSARSYSESILLIERYLRRFLSDGSCREMKSIMHREINIHLYLVTDESGDKPFQDSPKMQAYQDYQDFLMGLDYFLRQYDCQACFDEIEYLNSNEFEFKLPICSLEDTTYRGLVTLKISSFHNSDLFNSIHQVRCENNISVDWIPGLIIINNVDSKTYANASRLLCMCVSDFYHRRLSCSSSVNISDDQVFEKLCQIYHIKI